MGRFREAAILTLMMAIASTVSQPLQPSTESKSVDAGVIRQTMGSKRQKNQSLTRAELASILVQTFNVEDRRSQHIRFPRQSSSVKDVPPFHWAYPEIQSVVQTGVMTTFPGDNFRPDQTVTRAEGFAAIAQAYGEPPLSPHTAEAILKNFPDGEEIPEWAKPSMAILLSKGWVNLRDDLSIDPDKPLTRGDVAHTLSVYLSQHPTRQRSRTDLEDFSIISVGFFSHLHPSKIK